MDTISSWFLLKFKKLPEKRKIIVVSLITVLVLAFFSSAFYLLFRAMVKEGAPPQLPERELTKGEILEKLSAPGDTKISDEEKEEILKKLSAPKKETLSPKEKEEILKSLSAPEVGE